MPDSNTSAPSVSTDPPHLLTIAQAAQRLNTNEMRLRRLLKRQHFAECLHTFSRKTSTGTRSATGVPLGLLPELRLTLESEQNASQPQQPGEALALRAQMTVMQGMVEQQRQHLETLQQDNAILREALAFAMDQARQAQAQISPASNPDSRQEARTHAKPSDGGEYSPEPRRWWQRWSRK